MRVLRKHIIARQAYYLLVREKRLSPICLLHIVHRMSCTTCSWPRARSVAVSLNRCLSEPRLDKINYIQTPTALLTSILCEALFYFFSSALGAVALVAGATAGAEAPVFILARRPTQGTVSTATYWVKPSVC